MSKALNYIFAIIALAALSAAVYGYYHPIVRNVPGDTQYVEVEVPKPYKVISKVTVTVTEIKVITKTEIKEKWPDWFTGDPNQQLTAIGLVEPYRGKTECASVINISTGDSRIVTKRLPVPMFGFGNTIRVGVVAGFGSMLHGEWAFARVGNGYVSLSGALASSMGQSVAVGGLGGTMEW